MRAILGGGLFLFVFLVLFSCIPFGCRAEEELVPVAAERVEMMVAMNDTRRRLGSFQICALCTCCGGGSRNYCLATPCCYAINCNIPNRPFGFCSFTPKTCNCFGCHL